MDWENEPATWKQLRFLKNHGHKPDRHLTKTVAAELIQRLGGDEAISQTTPQPTATIAPAAVVHQIRDDAFQLRTAVERAANAATQPHRENFHDLQQQLAIATSKRQLFWIDTCRDPTRMQAACGQVLDFYRKYGCQFEAPSHKQVQEVLTALDSAVPAWDRDHPELFYQTLELNFPELKRRR
ncbi:MAG TPA: hypothetical protein VFE51_00160 [Verrucomicrobiae bacterium]|nr:hypothetical protein [Verrucomicrobiae bacterium]